MRGIKKRIGTVDGRRILKGFVFDQYALGRLLAGAHSYHEGMARKFQTEIYAVRDDAYAREFIFGCEADPVETEAKLVSLDYSRRLHEEWARAYAYADSLLKKDAKRNPKWLGNPMDFMRIADNWMVMHPVSEGDAES